SRGYRNCRSPRPAGWPRSSVGRRWRTHAGRGACGHRWNMASVARSVVDVEVVEVSRRPVARVGGGVVALETRGLEQVFELLVMLGSHLLGHAVGAERGDVAADVDAGLVDRVAQGLA